MGATRGQTDQSAPIDLLWPDSDAVKIAGVCQLCENRAPHKVDARGPRDTISKNSRLTHQFRIAHRLRDMQTLPYVVVTNSHLSYVYDLYYKAFERFRRIPEIKTLDDNDRYCKIVKETLQEHTTVIPRLAMGVLEIQGLMAPEETDKFMNTLLRSVRNGQEVTTLCGIDAD